MKVVIALGSNLGDRAANIEGAISKISNFCKVNEVSKLFETAPVGGPEQPDYLNVVLVGDCELDPHELLIKCLEIENQFGRTREVRWGARILDIDLILVGETEVNSENLILPHPLAHTRKFVLEPWYSIDPTAVIPGRGPISQLLAALN
ncbi:MAG: 2-amino-4-hydroxy-6-hydroxymethyldihydropteridine diphosphokinase [Actinomycetota bacterium]|jgi:2-amino-4-hydroxy-6-hydroxymethyldihydropteridine diphosphokinase